MSRESYISEDVYREMSKSKAVERDEMKEKLIKRAMIIKDLINVIKGKELEHFDPGQLHKESMKVISNED